MPSSKAVKIRLATKADSQSIKKLLLIAKNEYLNKRGAAQLFNSLDIDLDHLLSKNTNDINNYVCLVAHQDSALVGLLLARAELKSLGFIIEILYVPPEKRRQKLGTALVATARALYLTSQDNVEIKALPGDRVAKSFCETLGLKARLLIMSGTPVNNEALAVGAVVVKDKKLLLVKRAHNPNKGKWAFPGGSLLKNERAQTGVLRELLEETNLNGNNPELIAAQWILNNEYLVLNFKVNVKDFSKIKPSDDAADLGFFSISEIKQLPVVKSVLDFIYQHKIL